MESPKVTLIIPTKGRAETLRYTLRSALDQSSNAYEIIASDNWSQDDTPEVLRTFTDRRLMTLRTDRPLSMGDHWEFALRHARGEYVVFIGDDDAVLPHGIDELIALIERRPSKAYFWKPPVYAWPMDGRPAWIRFLPRPTRETELLFRPRVARVLRYGGWTYANLPGVYHSAISRRILDTIRERTGRVFHSTQPDVFTAMAVPVFAENYIRASSPFTLHGLSAKSNGGASIVGDPGDALSRFLRESGSYALHPTLYPGIPANANLVVDAILVAMDLFPEFYGRMRLNYDAMWAFLHRFGGAGALDILKKRRDIRRFHRFNVPRFIGYLLLQQGVVHARELVKRLISLRRRNRRPPENILDFARMYSNP